MLLEMTVKGLTIDPLTSTPIVILKDAEGKNAVPIWIGLMEASAIATELEKIQLSRPMTHDLMRNILESLDAKVMKIVINDLKDNTFYALIHILIASQELVIDSRPSDAIALALRTGSPIMVDKKVIDKSRKVDLTKEEGLSEEESKKRWAEILEKLSPDDFGKYKM
ncbi:MAG: bifunctional nuclease family protein [Deltaproteobacteria bacterium]|nr:MAG: bifunctional nuclease family protein [Deltaproteobacteria bacterium]